jgi:hypothetical protein
MVLLCDTKGNPIAGFNMEQKEHAVSLKSSLPWDLEHAMTAFQVNQNWYEEYWLRDTNDLITPQVHRRPDGSIDIDFYRGCAKRERDLAMKQACFALLAMLARLFRLAKPTPHVTRKDAGSTFPACKAYASRHS